MSDRIDCLILGYTALDRTSKGYQDIVKIYPDVEDIPHPLNSAVTYLGTALDKRNLSFDFVNSIEDEFDIAIKKVKSKNYFSIAISTTLCPDITDLIGVVNAIKNIDPDIPIIVGGPLIVYLLRCLHEKDLQKYFQDGFKKLAADYILNTYYGEDELAILISNLKNNIPVETIPNLYVHKDGQYACKVSEEIRYHPDEHVVNWDLFKGRTGGAVVVRTSVSCCFNCSFCSLKLNAGQFRSRHSENIEEELNQIEVLGEVKTIHFTDDTFNVPLSRFKKHLRMFIKNKYTFKWHSFLRCKNIDEEAVQLMVESGCVGVFLGIESGNNDVLKVMNKSATVEDYRSGIALLKKYNITIIAAFFIGYPGETIQSVKDTFRFIEEIDTFCYLGTWYFDPFTPIVFEREKYKLTGEFTNWAHKGMNVDTANKLVLQMRPAVKNSIWLDVINYAFLFNIMVIKNLELSDIIPTKKIALS